MSDLDKVVKGMEFCNSTELCSKECPYFWNNFCQDDLRADALGLLREYQKEKERNPVVVCPHCGKRVK